MPQVYLHYETKTEAGHTGITANLDADLRAGVWVVTGTEYDSTWTGYGDTLQAAMLDWLAHRLGLKE